MYSLIEAVSRQLPKYLERLNGLAAQLNFVNREMRAFSVFGAFHAPVPQHP
jgi:hypothetical protein